jgi:hypothetical protein
LVDAHDRVADENRISIPGIDGNENQLILLITPSAYPLETPKRIKAAAHGLLINRKNKKTSVRRTLRRHAQFIQMPAAGLMIRAFGRAEVIVNGRTIAMSDWKTKSVRDLFFYFLQNEAALTKEQIAEVLWLEITDPQVLKKRFKDETTACGSWKT